MADEEYGDDGFYFDDDDYLYVEDAFAIADELAEGQIPSPGYAGTNNELEQENFEYDIYEYFGELEYADDTYWDSSIAHLGGDQSPAARAGEKRKRAAPTSVKSVVQSAKRRKVSGTLDGAGELEENVIYKSFKQRLTPAPPALERRVSFALLPDWKERFRDEGQGEVVVKKSMPDDMRRAAEAKDEEATPVKRRKGHNDEMVEDDDGEEWEDEVEEGEDEDDGDPLGGLDSDTLKIILKQKLSETGVNIEDEALDQMIEQLLSGSADDAAGNLASLLLGQAQESEDSTASRWLSQQGVQFEDQEAAEEATTPASTHAGPQISPSDSAVGISTSLQSKAIEAASEAQQKNRAATTTNAQQSSTLTNRKRKASDDDEDQQLEGQIDTEQQTSKRRQPSHALPQPPPPEPTTAPEAQSRRNRRAVSTRHGK